MGITSVRTLLTWRSSSSANAKNISPQKPFFMYYCPGTGHAPHHIFTEWSDKFKGKFDMGWDEYRNMVFANQKKLGMFEPGAVLSPPDPRCAGVGHVVVTMRRSSTRG